MISKAIVFLPAFAGWCVVRVVDWKSEFSFDCDLHCPVGESMLGIASAHADKWI